MKRATRGLAIGLSLSIVNLLGVFLTTLLLGGLGDWTRMQFVGVFGIFEVATGVAFVVCPNVWRMPVIEAETSRRTEVRLAWSALMVPHRAALAKSAAGMVMVVAAIWTEGFGPATPALLPWAGLVAVFVVAGSAAVARWGVVHPSLDVVQFVIRRPGKKEQVLPGLSISASVLQILAGTFTIPAIKVFRPELFYGPEFRPSIELFAYTLGVTVLTVGIALFVWRNHLDWQAPREQQRATENA